MYYYQTSVPLFQSVSYGAPINPKRDLVKSWVMGRNLEGRNNRMSWLSQNEQYGSFSPRGTDKTYLPQLPHITKNVLHERVRQKLPSSNAEYGNFYKVEHDPAGTRKYQLQRHPVLPAIGTSSYVAYDPNQRQTLEYDNPPPPPLNLGNMSDRSANQNAGDISDRSLTNQNAGLQRHPIQEAGRDPNHGQELHLADIKEIDVQLLTKDYTALSLRPTNHGYQYTSYPQGVHSVRVPDITEVGLRIRQADGSVLNFYAKPK